MSNQLKKVLDIISMVLLFIIFPYMFFFANLADGELHETGTVLGLLVLILLSIFLVFAMRNWKTASKVFSVILIIFGIIFSTSIIYLGGETDLVTTISVYVMKYWVAAFGIIALIMVLKFWKQWESFLRVIVWLHLIVGVIVTGFLINTNWINAPVETPLGINIAFTLVAILVFVLIPLYLSLRARQ